MTHRENKYPDASILIVDDNPANVQLLDMLLKVAGYVNVRSTTDPRDVAGLFDEHKFDLLLLDIRMPHMDGHQVMEQLHQRIEGDYLPVLVLTAQTDQETRLRALQNGAKDFVSKPFNNEEILNRIHNMLEVRMFYNERRQQAEVLERKVEERTHQLSALQDVTMIAMGSLAETRDNDTGNHIRRTQHYIKTLAERLADTAEFKDTLTPEVITLLYKSAPLHDIGKVGIPDHVLLKPGKLTAEEFEIMKTHTTLGADAIEKAEANIDENDNFLCMGHEIAKYHHEKWDGSGYPDGLAGEDIPLCARLMAVADVYDALISARPYKQPKTHEEAVDIMREGQGSHFDPRIFEVFLDSQDQFQRIAERFSDEV